MPLVLDSTALESSQEGEITKDWNVQKGMGKTQALEEMWDWGSGRRLGGIPAQLGGKWETEEMGGGSLGRRRKENEARGAG